MTKLEKIEEMIREYDEGIDVPDDFTDRSLIDAILGVIEDDNRYYDQEVTPRTVHSDEIDFDIGNGVLIKYTGSEEHVVVPEGIDQLGKHSLAGCKNLKSVTLSKGLKFVNDNAFAGCTNLENVTFPDGLEYIGERVFMNCYSLKKINIPDSVEQISREAFICCDSLKSVSIPQDCSVNTTAFPRTCKVTWRNSEPKRTREMKV